MTRYITCSLDMSEVLEWECSGKCKECKYSEFYKKDGYWNKVVSEFNDIRKRRIANATKEGHSNRRRKRRRNSTDGMDVVQI